MSIDNHPWTFPYAIQVNLVDVTKFDHFWYCFPKEIRISQDFVLKSELMVKIEEQFYKRHLTIFERCRNFVLITVDVNRVLGVETRNNADGSFR